MLGSLIAFAAGLIGCSQCNTYSSLMACRVIQNLGSGVCEALPVQLVNDIFFIHERGKRLGYYTVALCLGATGPLYAGYMLAGGYSWRLFFYVEFAFACALLIMAFFFVEETSYDRENMRSLLGAAVSPEEQEKGADARFEEIPSNAPGRKSFVQTLKPWSGINHGAPFFSVMWRCFTYFLVPQVFWVVTTYGIYIGLGALAFNFTFPIKIVAPPYNWSAVSQHGVSVDLRPNLYIRKTPD